MKKASGIRRNVEIPSSLRDVEWQGVLSLSGGHGQPAFEATEELIGYFSRLATSGALASAAEHLHVSRFQSSATDAEGSLKVAFEARALHLGAWRILLQMLSHCHEMEPYKHLELKCGLPDPGDLLNFEGVLVQVYPNRLLLPGIQMELNEDALGSTEFSVRIESGRELLPNEVAGISRLVDDWGTLVYTGGFTPIDRRIEDALLNKPSTYRLSSRVVEISVTGWDGEPQAIWTLVNLAQALSRDLPVLTIQLE